MHFSYYSEEFGQFDEAKFAVEASDQFEARQKAWERVENDESMQYASCIKQCGVTWEASPINLQDYFNMMAAFAKYGIQETKNVDIPNAVIYQDDDRIKQARDALSHYWGNLDAISNIAKDFGQQHGMIPPDIFDELHYAALIARELEQSGKTEQAWELYDKTYTAEKWDLDAMHSIKQLFRDGSIWLCGESEYLGNYFCKDGIYPEKAALTDYEDKYISRWHNARHIDKLSRLPMFGEKDVISEKGGFQLPYEYHVLVIRQDALPKEQQKPENMLWTPVTNGDITQYAQNMITGVFSKLSRSDFIGVLRPEFENKIDFETLKSEYAAAHENTRHSTDGLNVRDEIEDEQEDEIY